jgi:hypothetical protein
MWGKEIKRQPMWKDMMQDRTCTGVFLYTPFVLVKEVVLDMI